MIHIRRLTVLALAAIVGVGGMMTIAGCSPKSGPQRTMGHSSAARVAPGKATKRVKIGLVADPHSPIPDVPVPVGFRLDQSVSRSSESGDTRVIDHTYAGRAGNAEIQEFYLGQMKRYGWTLSASQRVHLVVAQQYRREKPVPETCELRITTEDNMMSVFALPKTKVIISIRPDMQRQHEDAPPEPKQPDPDTK